VRSQCGLVRSGELANVDRELTSRLSVGNHSCGSVGSTGKQRRNRALKLACKMIGIVNNCC
jgi:hypothetical protein